MRARWAKIDPDVKKWYGRLKNARVRGGDVNLIPTPSRQCATCSESKPITEFQYTSPNISNCKSCVAKSRRPIGRIKVRDKWLQRAYGITLEQYRGMLVSQGGLCAICKTDYPGGRWGQLCVDHDHASGRVRGLLCGRCNKALGMIRERPVVALSMVDYIYEHASQS